MSRTRAAETAATRRLLERWFLVNRSHRMPAVGVLGCLVGVMQIPFIPPTAYAGVVRPGETVVVTGTDDVVLDGPVLATAVLPFSIEYQPPSPGEFADFSGTLEGSLINLVVRDSHTGTLTFVYDVDFADAGPADASEASTLGILGFGSFKTDIDGGLDFENIAQANRSGDGDQIRLISDDPGLGGAPRLVVRTDATDFDALGNARFFAGDLLDVETPDGEVEAEFASGVTVLGGTFRPIESISPEPPPGPGPVPNPIPLPPAVWSGAVGLCVAGLCRIRKRHLAG